MPGGHYYDPPKDMYRQLYYDTLDNTLNSQILHSNQLGAFNKNWYSRRHKEEFQFVAYFYNNFNLKHSLVLLVGNSSSNLKVLQVHTDTFLVKL